MTPLGKVWIHTRIIRGPQTGEARETRAYVLGNIVLRTVGKNQVVDTERSAVLEWSSTRSAVELAAGYAAKGYEIHVA